jgi:hypothetical protein
MWVCQVRIIFSAGTTCGARGAPNGAAAAVLLRSCRHRDCADVPVGHCRLMASPHDATPSVAHKLTRGCTATIGLLESKHSLFGGADIAPFIIVLNVRGPGRRWGHSSA